MGPSPDSSVSGMARDLESRGLASAVQNMVLKASIDSCARLGVKAAEIRFVNALRCIDVLSRLNPSKLSIRPELPGVMRTCSAVVVR